MKTTRRALLGAAVVAAHGAAQTGGGVKRYARYVYQNRTRIGLVEGEMIRELRGEMLGQHQETGAKHRLKEVKLLYPVAQPSKILALAGNYRSHLGNRPPAKFPEPFYKPPSSLQNPDDAIVYPKDATNLHPECELVIVMGKRASKIGVAEAKAAIFGVTCGNDVSEREWQNGAKKDVQWWRAKGADTFSPVGPWVVTGLDYGNLKIECRINGKTVQSDHTSQLIHNCETTVSYISQYVTLEPGDLIFTGTNGQTVPMRVGDVVEVEIEGIGVLRNKVVAG